MFVPESIAKSAGKNETEIVKQERLPVMLRVIKTSCGIANVKFGNLTLTA